MFMILFYIDDTYSTIYMFKPYCLGDYPLVKIVTFCLKHPLLVVFFPP